jgi:hypothetical protein
LADTDSQRIHVDRDHEQPRSGGRATWIGLGLAAVIVLGLLIWLPSLLGAPEPDAVSASTVPPPATTVPTTALTIDYGPRPELPPPTSTGFGLLVWSRLDAGLMPNADVQVDLVDGGYYSYFTSGESMRSTDGLHWYFDPNLEPVDAPFYQSGRWGITYAESSSLYELVDGHWQPVVTEAPAPAGVEGLVWDLSLRIPAETDDRIVIPVELWGRIPWEEVYGRFELADCEAGPTDCLMEPWSDWNEFAKRTFVHNPTGGPLLASLRTVRRDSAVVFEDQETGDEVWRIAFTDSASAAAFLEGYKVDNDEEMSSMRRFGTFTGPNTANLTFVETPFARSTQVLANDEGLFVGYEDPPGWAAGSFEIPLWTSDDGVNWQPGQAPEFVDEDLSWATIQGGVGDAFYATIYRDNQASERWESSDGLHWQPSDIDLPDDAWILTSDFGYAAVAWMESLPEFFASPDGITWEQIPSPESHPGYNGYAIAAGVAGDLIYMITETPSGDRIFWSAKFD